MDKSYQSLFRFHVWRLISHIFSFWPHVKGDKALLKDGRGFTLIELVVVMGIIGVIAAIATPNFLSLLPSIRVNTATRQVLSKMLLIKMKAISENRSYRLIFSPGGDKTRLQIQMDVDPKGWDASDPIIETIDLPSKIIFDTNASIKPGGGSITCDDICLAGNMASFTPYGTATSGSIYLIPKEDKGTARTDRMRAISLNTTGRVQAWKYTSGSDPWKKF